MRMEKEKLATIAPGRLCALVTEGLRGHHPLFERDAIVAALATPDVPVAREDAPAVGQALLAICRDSPAVARGVVAALPGSAHTALIRLYFRLLDRAQEEQPLRH
jgi:hypothetical protein